MALFRLLPQQLPYDMHRGGAEEGTHCSESMPGHQALVSSSVKWANTPSFQVSVRTRGGSSREKSVGSGARLPCSNHVAWASY